MQEIWRRYRDTHYSASNTGKIRNDKTGRILKPRKTKRGYCNVTIDGKCYRTHRVIAEVFIPNPHNLPQVNHKDENKSNNSVDNLEWCDARYNKTYSAGVQVIQINPTNGEIIKTYSSLTQAAETVGVCRHNIRKCINGKQKIAGGFKWLSC